MNFSKSGKIKIFIEKIIFFHWKNNDLFDENVDFFSDFEKFEERPLKDITVEHSYMDLDEF